MTRPCWLRRAVRNRHRDAIEQASRHGVEVEKCAHRETLESFVVFGSGECARTLRALARCPKLRHLDFAGWAFEHGGNSWIDDAGARAVVESCRNLTDFPAGE